MKTWRAAAEDIAALLAARHGEPFAVLGPHRTRTGWLLRALLPGAERAELLTAEGGGQSRLGRIGQASQFIPMQKLCRRRRKTLVLTVPSLRTCSRCSARVSKMTLSRIFWSAVSLEKVCQRLRFSLFSGLLAMTLASACSQVRAATPGSEAAE